MEGVQTVDVSWLHHSQKDHLQRTKSTSSTNEKSGERENGTTSSKSHRRSRSNSNPARSPLTTSEERKEAPNDLGTVEEKVEPGEGKATEQKPISISSTPLPTTQRSAPKPVGGRRNSWISSLSSKFSSGSTPPSQSSLKGSPASPKATSPLDAHNPFGAAYSPKDKEEEKKDETNPFTSSSPKSPSFIHNALRKFSSSSGGLPKLPSHGAICPRRVMNLDPSRDRCKIAELNQAKLHRVAFCVDVEIAGISHRDTDEDAPPTCQLRQPLPESNRSKSKKAEAKADTKAVAQCKENEEAEALKNPQAAVAEKEAPVPASTPALATTPATTPETAPASVQGDTATQDAQSTPAPAPAVTPADSNPAESKPNGETKDPSRKVEKKKRSEEERKERKERKRRQAVANGSIPLQLDAENDDDDEAPAPAVGVSRLKTQSHPTTDPVRIYRRCCQLRETPVLKRIVDQISAPSSTLAESPGTVAALDLSNFPMTSQDITTFSDWLAVVPVRKLILENCALADDSVRAILAGLLSTKTVEQMRYRRRRNRRSDSPDMKEERWGVIEKLSLKDNPKIGPQGWRHIGLFVHLSRSLKAIDLSGIPFPKCKAPPDVPTASNKPPPHNICTIFSDALAERFAGDHLEELLLTECKPSVDQVKRICEASTKMGLRRLGFANNSLTREGLEHVVEYFKAGSCEGLDLGGNPIKDDLDLLTDAIEPEQPFYALSLADCDLNPTVICRLLQALTRLHNLRFIDVSHNLELFSVQPNALGAFRRFLPKMPSLKRIHLADVDLSPDHVIGLAEILPECPSLCHLSILENPQIVRLASATNPVVQEEACAVYASMMAAVRVSRTIIAVDIEVPTAENNEVVKALASQIVAYSLRNLEGGAIAEELSEAGVSLGSKEVPVPEILQHIVGIHGPPEEPCGEEDDDPAPDEDYVIGGTGVVKALGVCLGNLDHHHAALDALGDHSAPPSGTTTPRRRKSRSVVTKRPRDMSKNLLESARNIRVRIQSALIREDKAGNDANYRRLQFLDYTLAKMIQRFEDEYPETRLPQSAPTAVAPDSSSQNSAEDANGTNTTGNLHSSMVDENAVDDEETDNYGIHLSRTSSMTSLHARAMTSEEGHVHRLGQNLRRDFLNPPEGEIAGDEDDDSHVIALREKLERLHGEQSESPFDSDRAEQAFEMLGQNVDELWAAQRQDAEGFERFKQSQIAAQINSGLRAANGSETDATTESKSLPS
ncbi:60S ribosomal protein L5 [Penicillium atrosanguineum]|uniref:Cell wall biogenesis protein Mhp1 n=1 Tax=Penicillium atrosanguineum TaxID=1132637 RepID=A0A9W9UEN9_9EURO|nr:60S ribosomal protein L5 [Penicillium atrosanguineum]KAJ5147213.1 hypothetical protein N7526_000565 [Penicillium atrosanguineum]KAJ5314308.1 60S ribosomal protein L5 [Penicillium atrosanguineum]KAJ5331475.1 hypothetical protein N7476_001258 [Penicillium atrosanguineum]